MIRVTVEMVPKGIESKKYLMGTATITNMASGTRARGNYTFSIFSANGRRLRSVEVWHFPRRRFGAWRLLARSLENYHMR